MHPPLTSTYLAQNIRLLPKVFVLLVSAIFRLGALPALPPRVSHGYISPAAHTYTPFQPGCYPRLPCGYSVFKDHSERPILPEIGRALTNKNLERQEQEDENFHED